MITKFKQFESSYFHTQTQIDDILQKIFDDGYISLSQSEKAILNNFSKDDADIHKILVKISRTARELLEFKNKLINLTKNTNGKIDDEKQSEFKKRFIELNTILRNHEMTLKHLYNIEDSQDIYRYQKDNDLLVHNDDLFENKKDIKPAKEGLERSHLPKEMKEKIYPYIGSDSYYSNKTVYELDKPKLDGKNFDGVNLGADKDGFFVYTHRSRTNSYKEVNKIPLNKIAFVKSTG